MSPQSQLTHDLLALGVRPGGVLLVHSSLRALGPQHEPEMVVQALLAALGPQGTLLMPALSYASVGASQPVFDARRTPSCVGGLTEYFRTRQSKDCRTLRSLHPTHSVSGIGPLAGSGLPTRPGLLTDLLRGHEQDCTPGGPHSPFARLPQLQGQILFLGCGLRPNTSMHAIEEEVEPPYLYGPPVDYTIVDLDGNEIPMRVRSHSFKGWAQRYDRLANPGVMNACDLRTGPVLQAECHLLEAAAMWPAALAKLREDPFFFVERNE